MRFGLSTGLARILIFAGFALCLLAALQVRSCQQARQTAAESRLQRGQTKALSRSAEESHQLGARGL